MPEGVVDGTFFRGSSPGSLFMPSKINPCIKNGYFVTITIVGAQSEKQKEA